MFFWPQVKNYNCVTQRPHILDFLIKNYKIVFKIFVLKFHFFFKFVKKNTILLKFCHQKTPFLNPVCTYISGKILTQKWASYFKLFMIFASPNAPYF